LKLPKTGQNTGLQWIKTKKCNSKNFTTLV